jgi:hypothetical protein
LLLAERCAHSIAQGQRQIPLEVLIFDFAALRFSQDEHASGRLRNCPGETFS